MKYAELPGTKLNVSRIALGTLFLGGVEETEAIKTIHNGIDQGINLIDTAEAYGRGATEEILGRALAGRRDKVILATKGGIDWNQHAGKVSRSSEAHINMAGLPTDLFRNSNHDYITKSIDDSLKRLKTDYIDLYQIHYPNTTTAWDDTINALEKARIGGKIRYYGLSNFSVPQMNEWMKISPIYSLQTEYNMLDRRIEEEIMPFCIKSGIGILTYGSLGYGLLSGKFSSSECPQDMRKDLRIFKGVAFSKNVAIVEELKDIFSSKETTMAQLSIAWVIAQPGITSALVGMKNLDQLKENIKSLEYSLSDDELKKIRKILEEEVLNNN